MFHFCAPQSQTFSDVFRDIEKEHLREMGQFFRYIEAGNKWISESFQICINVNPCQSQSSGGVP